MSEAGADVGEEWVGHRKKSWGENGARLNPDWDDDEYRQSTTACCPRQTIPDGCSCLEDCDCLCADCDCGMDDG